MSRTLRIALSVVALGVALVGCTDDEPAPRPAPPATSATGTVEDVCAVAEAPSDPDDLLGTYEDLLAVAPPEVAGDLQTLVAAMRQLEGIDEGAGDAAEQQAAAQTSIDESSAEVAGFLGRRCGP